MKKLFTLALALLGFAGVSNAATVDDLKVCQHSYVLVCDDYTQNGTGTRTKGALFGDGYFLDVTGGSVATNKGQVDLSVVNETDDNHVTAAIAAKYGEEYAGPHYNSLRLKNAQDVIAMKVTAKSKIIFFLQGNNKTQKEARIPKIATDAKLENALNNAPDENFTAYTDAGFRYEWTADDDKTIYIGSYNGDMFVSFIIVEANEAPGTPTVKISDQYYDEGKSLWVRDVTCKANGAKEEGADEATPTFVVYTTDGSEPNLDNGEIYSTPISCYDNATIKFQAYYNWGNPAEATEDDKVLGADIEANVNFQFNAPSIAADGANITITSEYAGKGATNYYTLNGGEAAEGDTKTLEESATVSAYTVIKNGDATFTSMSTTKDVYVLSPIKDKKTIAVTAANIVNDDENSEKDADGTITKQAYKVEGGEISADKADFFVKNLSWKVLKNGTDDAQYQVPEGQEAYIQMSNTNITFLVAAGDSIDVTVTCTKNACKNIAADDADDGSAVNDRKCFVNVSGKNYGGEDLKLNPEGNVIKFGLKAGEADTYYTFQKYSGTGNIMISSIDFEWIDPSTTGISTVKSVAENAALYNLAGQKVSAAFKGVVVKNGKKVVLK